MTTKALKEAIHLTFSAYGKVGGKSRSPAKRAASRLNAAKAAAARRKNSKH